MKNILAIGILFLFSFCSKKERSPYPHLIVAEEDSVIKVNTNIMLESTINDLAIGFDKDVIVDGKVDVKVSNKEFVYFANTDTIFPRFNFKIIVDTSYTIPAKYIEYKSIDLPDKRYKIVDGLINGKEPTQNQIKKQAMGISQHYDMRRKLWDDYVECLPLLVLNNDTIPAYITEMRMIQEAKDKDGVWRPIEFYERLKGCIVQHHIYQFKPKKYKGIAIIKYNGNFKTKLRVKIQINNHYYYSNEFEGSINRSQFSHDYLKKYIDYHEGSFNDEDYKEKYEKWTLLQYDF